MNFVDGVGLMGGEISCKSMMQRAMQFPTALEFAGRRKSGSKAVVYITAPMVDCGACIHSCTILPPPAILNYRFAPTPPYTMLVDIEASKLNKKSWTCQRHPDNIVFGGKGGKPVAGYAGCWS